MTTKSRQNTVRNDDFNEGSNRAGKSSSKNKKGASSKNASASRKS